MSKQSNNLHLPLVILAVLALAFVPILLNLNRKITQPKALTCTSSECSTSSGCQLTGYSMTVNGVNYTCAGNNEWNDPEGNLVQGDGNGPVVEAIQEEPPAEEISTNYDEQPNQVKGEMEQLPVDAGNQFFQLEENGNSFSGHQTICEYENNLVKSGNLYTLSGSLENVGADTFTFTLSVGNNQYEFNFDSRTTFSEWSQYNFCDQFYKIYPAEVNIYEVLSNNSGSSVTVYFDESSTLDNLYAFHVAGSKKVEKTIIRSDQ